MTTKRSSVTDQAGQSASWSILQKIFCLLLVAIICGDCEDVYAQMGGDIPNPDNTPTTDTDVGSTITSGCAVQAWSGSISRHVVDFEIPGAVSEHGLKWERTYNSSTGGWSFAYNWRMLHRPYFTNVEHVNWPDGRFSHFEVGTKERLFNRTGNSRRYGIHDLHTGDGSIIQFERYSDTIDAQETRWLDNMVYTPLWLKDRRGNLTLFEYESAPNTDSGHIRLTKVTDAASGRWIRIIYGASTSLPNDWWLPTRVEGSDGHWVDYKWKSVSASIGPNVSVLEQVDYSDGPSAYYTYEEKPWGSGGNQRAVVLTTARDTHATGPMQNIFYEYHPTGRFRGQIQAERFLNADNSAGVTVTSLQSTAFATATEAIQTETRGDGATRKIRFKKLVEGKGPPFVMWKEDYNAKQETYTYNSNYFLKSVADRRPQQYTTTFTLESHIGNPLSRIHPDQTRIDYTYSDTFYPYYLKTVKNERTYTTTYNRADPAHPNLISSINHPDGGLESFAYNNFHQVLRHQLPNNKTDGSARYKHYQYDGTGMLRYEWNPTTNASANPAEPRTEYVYWVPNDPDCAACGNAWQNRVKKKIPPANAQGLVNVEVYEYDRALDGNGETTGVPVLGRGLVTKISYPNDTHNGTISGGTYKLFAYDKYGNKVWEENEKRERTRYTYDDYKRVVSTIQPSPAGTTTNNYSPSQSNASLAYAHTTSNPYFVTDPVGIVTACTYDPNWRKTSSAVAGATTRFGYDEVGNQTKVTDPRGTVLGDSNYTTTTGYDSRNRKTSVTDPLAHATSFFYDDNLNLTRIVRADGSAETKQYDQMNRVISHTMPKEGTPTAPSSTITTTFAYNKSGSLASVTVPQGSAVATLTTTFEYDPSDLKTKMLYPNASDYQSWTYDNIKNVVSRRTVSNKTQTFTYDSRNRKMSMRWSNSIDWADLDYDEVGRLTTANNPFSSITRGYDAAGRLNLDRQNSGVFGAKDVQYDYDAANKPTRLFLASNSYDYTFTYDSMGRFEKIWQTGAADASFQYFYDLASNETHRLNKINNIDQDYGIPDSVNRMQKRELKNNGTRLAVAGSLESYGYDLMNRLTIIDREDGKRDAFTYYLNGELLNAKYGLVNNVPSRNVDYTIDKSGNRTQVNETGQAPSNATYVPNNLNQYTSVGGLAVGGGSEHEISSYDSAAYTYINDERLQSVTQNGNTYQLGYDALGRCVKRVLTTGGTTTTTYYVYDGEKPIAEFKTSGGIVGKNLYGKGIDEVLMRTASSVLYYQQDHQGSVTHVFDGTGAILESYRYDAFGKPTIFGSNGLVRTSGDSAIGNRFMFTGREYASTFGIYEYRARAYHPALGRFMNEDPKLFVRRMGMGAARKNWSFGRYPDETEFNLFRYCGNDPLDFTDPTGEIAVVDDAAVAAVVTAAIAAAYLSTPQGREAAQDAARAAVNTIGAAIHALQDSHGVQDVDGKPGWQGKPGSTARGEWQSTRYGPDGYAETQTDKPHPGEGQKQTHAHDIGRPKDGGPPTDKDRGPARPWKQGDPPPGRKAPPPPAAENPPPTAQPK